MKQSTVLRKAIQERRAVAVVGCHDAFSARLIEQAVATVLANPAHRTSDLGGPLGTAAMGNLVCAALG